MKSSLSLGISLPASSTSTVWPPIMPKAPVLWAKMPMERPMAEISSGSMLVSKALAAVSKAYIISASPVSTPMSSPYSAQVLGLPRRRRSSSIHGKSS